MSPSNSPKQDSLAAIFGHYTWPHVLTLEHNPRIERSKNRIFLIRSARALKVRARGSNCNCLWEAALFVLEEDQNASMMEQRINCSDIDIFATDSDDISEVDSIITYKEYLSLQASGARRSRGYTLRTTSGSSDEESPPKHTKQKRAKSTKTKRAKSTKTRFSNPSIGRASKPGSSMRRLTSPTGFQQAPTVVVGTLLSLGIGLILLLAFHIPHVTTM